MATYSTDLTTLTTAESGNWYELTGTILGFTLSGAGSPAIDAENYIQGTNCYSQTTGKAVDAEISIVFDYGSGYSFSAGYVVFGWCFYAVGANLKTKANSGWMFVICDSLTTGDYFVIGGSDYGRNPYGGWTNVAIDPTATQSGTLGSGGNGSTYRYFGQVCNTIGEISKGTPSGVDAIRVGRGIISVTGSGGSFAELASYNDYNAGGTPPGTSSTSKDSGRHRLGLFQENSGVYLWKGLLSLGTSGASVTFSDSNETIIIDDCPHTYASFNKVEVNNASSSVTLNNITFISTASTANGIGHFEMVADATLAATGCSFNAMGTFVFDSNSTVTGCAFNSCGAITQGEATMTGCSFNSLTSPLIADDLDAITGCTFTSSGTGHAVNLGTIAATASVTWDNTDTGYAAQGGTAANRTILVNVAAGQTLTINVEAGATTPTYYNTGSGDVSVVAGSVTVKVTVKNAAGTAIENALVFIKASDGTGPFPYDETVTSITNSGTTATVAHSAHGMATGDYVVISGASLSANNGVFQTTYIDTGSYSYTMGSTPGSSPTGTIKCTFVALYGLTSALGVKSESRVYTSSQPITGWARKSTSSPFYQEGPISGEVDSGTGLSATAVLVLDE